MKNGAWVHAHPEELNLSVSDVELDLWDSFKLLGLWLPGTTNFRFWLTCNVLNSWAQWRPWRKGKVPAHCTI